MAMQMNKAGSRLMAALDALIPGHGGWPSASEAINPETLRSGLTLADRNWLDNAMQAGGDVTALWQQAEGTPEFQRLLHALNDAYYSAPATQPLLRNLANASPRDTDSRFDPALLDPKPERTTLMQNPKADTGITLGSPTDVARATTYEHGARCGDFIFVAGQVARDENNNWVGIGDARAQAEQVYKNIGKVLAHFGAGPQHVVKINAIMVDRADRDAATEPRLAFFGDHRPPHTGIVIASLGSPEVRIEVEVVAYLPQVKP